MASSKVVRSGTVGPEAITSILSLTTSDRINVNSLNFRLIISASLPPFTLDRCFLTVFISSIDAPEARSFLVISCFSAKLKISIGKGIRAEAPPDKNIITKSFFSTFLSISTILSVPKTPQESGIG